MNKKKILFIGNFHSHIGTHNICEYLSNQFQSDGYTIYTASKYKYWLFRVLDMLLKTYLYRKKYNYICLDVFSGRAFFWAYCIARFAIIFNKQYVYYNYNNWGKGNMFLLVIKDPEDNYVFSYQSNKEIQNIIENAHREIAQNHIRDYLNQSNQNKA